MRARRQASTGITEEPTHLTLSFHDPDRLPEALHLAPLRAEAKLGAMAAEVASRALCDVGFEDAGLWTVEGMPGMSVALLAHRAQSMLAAVHFAGDAKPWDELTTFYANGDEVTFTNLAAGGRPARSGARRVCVDGCCGLELYMRALTERPMGVMRSVDVATAATHYEHSYARWRAWCRSASDRERDARAA
jgi:hypothetical protein